MGTDVFQIGVAHVVDAEDVYVGVFRDGLADVGEESYCELFALSGGFGKVYDFGTLGFRHDIDLDGGFVKST